MDLRYFPDPCLRRHCKPVVSITPLVRLAIQDMTALMDRHCLDSLSAPLAGLDQQIVVLATSGSPEDAVVMLNPSVRVLRDSCLRAEAEWCPCLPGVSRRVIRPSRIRVGFYDLRGVPHEVALEGEAARVVAHEVQHLYGILFLDFRQPAACGPVRSGRRA